MPVDNKAVILQRHLTKKLWILMHHLTNQRQLSKQMPSMRPLRDHLVIHCVIGNLRNATCRTSHQCAVNSKTFATRLHTKGAPFYGPGHMDGMSMTSSLLVAYAKSTTWTATKMSCQIRPTVGLNAPGHGHPKRKTISGPSLTCLSLLQILTNKY